MRGEGQGRFSRRPVLEYQPEIGGMPSKPTRKKMRTAARSQNQSDLIFRRCRCRLSNGGISAPPCPD
jgi:hypothetical protein